MASTTKAVKKTVARIKKLMKENERIGDWSLDTLLKEDQTTTKEERTNDE